MLVFSANFDMLARSKRALISLFFDTGFYGTMLRRVVGGLISLILHRPLI